MSDSEPLSTALIRQAQQSLQQLLTHYEGPQAIAHQGYLEQIQALGQRLASPILRVAVFGLVSRGKSAVINAILGEPVLETGPLHGVTRWPRSVMWQPPSLSAGPDRFPRQIEFIDTPGLDEIEGEDRAAMAMAIAEQADLILLVVAGELTDPEYAALVRLQQAEKPLLLVFNKTDLYPEVDQQKIYDHLQSLAQASPSSGGAYGIGIDAVIQIAAAPAPRLVRTEWPDGRTRQDWESPPPRIEPLRLALSTLLRQDGGTLIALNVLRRARDLEAQTVQAVTRHRAPNSDRLIQRYAQYKALAIALSPLGIADLAINLGADLMLIRYLARLYGLPITNHGANQLWQSLLRGSGLLLLGEFGSLILGDSWGLGGSLGALNTPSGITTLLTTMALQAGIAGYSTYGVGKSARRYLEQGYTWSTAGISSTTQAVLKHTPSTPILARLRQHLQNTLDAVSSAPATGPPAEPPEPNVPSSPAIDSQGTPTPPGITPSEN